jgi:hypothetical protein
MPGQTSNVTKSLNTVGTTVGAIENVVSFTSNFVPALETLTPPLKVIDFAINAAKTGVNLYDLDQRTDLTNADKAIKGVDMILNDFMPYYGIIMDVSKVIADQSAPVNSNYFTRKDPKPLNEPSSYTMADTYVNSFGGDIMGRMF